MKKTKVFPADFSECCKVLNLDIEYPGKVGEAKFLILSDLNETELSERFGEVLSRLKPYVIWNMPMIEVINDYSRNQAKHSWRLSEEARRVNEDSLREVQYQEPKEECFFEKFIREAEEEALFVSEYRAIREAFFMLPEPQRHRLWMRVVKGMKYGEIARAEGISIKSAADSVKAGIKNLAVNFLKVFNSKDVDIDKGLIQAEKRFVKKFLAEIEDKENRGKGGKLA